MTDAAAKLRCAVVGVGHLGRFHAQKYAAMHDAELIAVCDNDRARAARVAAECGQVDALGDHRELIQRGRVDAVSIAVPAHHHFAIARDFLDAGVHVLLEKPIAVDVSHARELVELAERRRRILQIGHLERFNPAVMALGERLVQPLFIESYRIAPFQSRGTDVSVVLDLMIHDIDLLLALVDAPVQRVDASGTAVLTDDIDIVNARLSFANGCTANVTASRVSAKSECKMRLFQRDAYFSLDLREKKLTVRRKRAGSDSDGLPLIDGEQLAFEEHDALYLEIAAFLRAVRRGEAPLVSGTVGLRALQTAHDITRSIAG